MNIGINEFQTRVCFTVEYIYYNAKGRDILDIGLSGFNKRVENVKLCHEFVSVNIITLVFIKRSLSSII